ncbi:GAF domain-containing protein [Sphingobacterium sp. JUb56]|uniref:GAF domain-containing protein n=1 Tax=Sphingobacterium sp. JUb56 TaxID=2587145 RepID=UPI00160FF933|nr:GAF domain-containing protein [Sphingobacterium sp. JUb56]MBB2950346.1 hypothetical protein [Sphingobacterium sp. JUb56]
MQSALFTIINEEEDQFPEIETHLSFDPFLNYLKRKGENEISIKKNFLASVLKDFNQAFAKYGPLDKHNIHQFENEFRLIHASLNPVLQDDEDTYWALGFPLGQKICFGTDKFYVLLEQYRCDNQLALAHDSVGFSEKIQMLYSFILERLYGIKSAKHFEIIHSFIDALTGLQKYYRINIDHTFVDVKVIGNLPVFDRIKVIDEFSKTLNFEIIKTLIPLNKIKMDGFSILTVTDITEQQALENIKNIIIRGIDEADSYGHVIMALRTLAGNPAIEFSLLPFFKLNNKVVFDFKEKKTSALLDLLKINKGSEQRIQELLDEFIKQPQILVFSKDFPIEDKTMSFLWERLKDLGIVNYALIPIAHNKEIVGVIEVFTKTDAVLDEQILARIFSASTLLAQLLKDEIVEFQTKINEVIKEKFTSLQSAVQWKFNQEAWEYLQRIEQDKPKPIVGDIKFEQIYPLYGAIDIRNSTIERNKAAFQDMIVQLELLENVLIQLKHLNSIVILDEMIFNCRRWLQEINEELMDSMQIQLNDFFNQNVAEVLTYFKENLKESHPIIAAYENAIHPLNGVVYKNRNVLEKSIRLINSGISGYLELFEKELQNSYPCYFEKFRSDGIEYDIYIGQSIAPDKKFNEIYLKNIRLWQLTSMAAIAKITHSLLDQMEKRLLTTQLIFVNATLIDINFRTDEHRFDVEGAYNIRYQIIKKRIDKVTIKGSNERLTQPGKIAIVYFTKREEKEYLGYIQYLQKSGSLLDDLEELELEELQGVKGLQALRIGINLA